MTHPDIETGIDIEGDVFIGLTRDLSDLTKAVRQLVGIDYAVVPKQLIGVINPSTPLVIDLGGPAQGRAWDVRMVTVGPVSVFTADAGDLALVAIGAVAGTSFPFSEMVGAPQHVPFSTYHGGLRWLVRNGKHIYVVCSAMTTPLNATGFALEVPDLPEVLAKL